MPALIPAKALRFETADAMHSHYSAVGKRLGKASAEAKPVIVVLAAAVPAKQPQRRRAAARVWRYGDQGTPPSVWRK
jgi:hypothetical protein